MKGENNMRIMAPENRGFAPESVVAIAYMIVILLAVRRGRRESRAFEINLGGRVSKLSMLGQRKRKYPRGQLIK